MSEGLVTYDPPAWWEKHIDLEVYGYELEDKGVWEWVVWGPDEEGPLISKGGFSLRETALKDAAFWLDARRELIEQGKFEYL